MHLIRRTEAFAKLFFLISVTGLVMYIILAFYSFHLSLSSSSTQEPYNGLPVIDVALGKLEYDSERKYILLWSIPDYTDYKFGEGQAPFVNGGCQYTNCFITNYKDVLNEDYTNFDAVVFDINVVKLWPKKYMPKKRASGQKYIFYSLEASDYSPVCNVLADNYFNWTWTYNLNSDIASPFISVKTLKGQSVAPSVKARWITNMTHITEKSVKQLKSKSKAVVWIMNKCQSRINRMLFVKKLKVALQKHSLDLDIFGCDHKVCPYEECDKIIQKDYYFYLSYEHSNAEDFVTEDVLMAYDNNAVPIVMGNAKYNHFLPFGSYIDARPMSVEKLAALIYYNIRNPDSYHNYFRWKNHYVITKAHKSAGLCNLCHVLNSIKFTSKSQYVNLRKWWYTDPLFERCFPRGATKETALLSYLNKTTNRGNREKLLY